MNVFFVHFLYYNQFTSLYMFLKKKTNLFLYSESDQIYNLNEESQKDKNNHSKYSIISQNVNKEYEDINGFEDLFSSLSQNSKLRRTISSYDALQLYKIWNYCLIYCSLLISYSPIFTTTQVNAV